MMSTAGPMETTGNPWLMTFNRNRGARLRLFCFPYAGGRASRFRSWLSAVPQDVELVAVQLPGRVMRFGEAAFTDMNKLVVELTAAIVPALDRPFAFFGHSLGAIVAFEVARRLEHDHGRHPQHLFVSGRRAPSVLGSDIRRSDLPLDAFITSLRDLEGTPPEVLENPELLDVLLPTLRADFCLSESYQYLRSDPLTCPITVFAGTTDTETGPEHVAPWRDETEGAFSAHFLPGGHFFIHSAERQLLSILREALTYLARPSACDSRA